MELKIRGRRDLSAQTSWSQGSCGSTTDPTAHLPGHIRDKVRNHPCFSEEAHHHYARMHVAVAPACNIQCHYCNRRYDCSNESRPGVVSEVLTPEQAVRKTLAVAAKIPRMSVLGVAGPGDPLANPARTFKTFRALFAVAPDIKLCVSTNGLALPDCVDEIVRHNIEHVTITINCVDPEIGAKIHPWIFWKNRRIKGVNGARILIEQQQKGLEMLTERGILVKINSVMIPGVNDEHLREVSRIVKAKGAFLHNIMPLIAEPEHGTFFGVMGQRGPTALELAALRNDCEGKMKVMRHCQQCRADAVGLLGEDRGQEFTMERIEHMDIDHEAAMAERAAVHARIEAARGEHPAAEGGGASSAQCALPPDLRPVCMAVASTSGRVVDQHFGHAQAFLVYEVSASGSHFVGHRRTDQYCTGTETCGDRESTLERSIRALDGCEVVLCARIGFAPWERLEAAGIQPNGEHAMETIEQAIMAVYREMYASGALTSCSGRKSIA